MATVIDSLVMMFGLDGTPFKKGADEVIKNNKKLRDDADKTARGMQEEGKKASLFFSKIRNEALLFFGVFTAGKGLKDFTFDSLANAAALGRLSDNLAINIEELSSWQRASDRAGGSAAGITAQLQESQKAVAMFNTGMSDDSMLWFYNLGGTEKAFKDAKEYLLARADIIAETNKTDPGRAQLQAQQMGISPEQFNLLKQGRVAVLELVAAQEKHSRFTRKQAADAAKLENQLRDMRDSFAVTGTTILVALIPTLEKLFKWVERLANYFIAHKEDIANFVEVAVDVVGNFISILDGAAQAVGGWQNVMAGLLALKVASFALGLLSLGAGLTSVATGLTAIAGGGAALGVLGKLGMVGAAGAGGLVAGSAINKATEDTTFHKKLGEILARTMASLGSENAAESLYLTTGKNDYSKYYKPEDKTKKPAVAKTTKPPVVTPSPGEPAKESLGTIAVAKKLMEMGWTNAQAAGIAGSFNQESGLDANAKNKESGAYGIGQWLGSRVKDFEKWAGKPLQGSTQDEQLKFFQYEVTEGKEKRAGDRLRATTTAEDAANVHSKYYERPGAEEANVPRRQQMAAYTLAQLQRENALSASKMPMQAAAQTNQTTNKTNNTSTSETNINGNIIVNTAATDADGIAKSIGPALQKFTYADQANTGMT